MRFDPRYDGRTIRGYRLVVPPKHSGTNQRKTITLVVISRYVPHQSTRETSRRLSQLAKAAAHAIPR